MSDSGQPVTRRFWKVMHYECDRCHRRFEFYLEDGCEGPSATPDAWVTPSGRQIVPVPFIAAGCPECQGKAPWSLKAGSGCLVHVAWNTDKWLDPMLEVSEGPLSEMCHFRYPDNPRADRACGKPVLAAILPKP